MASGSEAFPYAYLQWLEAPSNPTIGFDKIELYLPEVSYLQKGVAHSKSSFSDIVTFFSCRSQLEEAKKTVSSLQTYLFQGSMPLLGPIRIMVG